MENRNRNNSESTGSVKDAKIVAVVPMTALMQPLIFSRTLIQVGYEPLEPTLGKSFFRRRTCYYYPNIFKYVNHLRKVEGMTTLFTGLTPKLCNVVLGTMTENVVEKWMREKTTCEGINLPPDRKNLNDTLYEMGICCASKTAGLVVSHPFHVMMVRMICSVINKDQAYNGLWNTIKEIYNDEGIGGFYSGFVPRWLAEMTVVSVGSFIMFGLYRLMSALDVEEESVRTSTNYSAIVQFGLSTMMYKYQLTSTVTAASCRGLNIGLPKYDDWTSVLFHLTDTNQLSRGSSYFYRKAVL